MSILVVFDLDGTLIDSRADLVSSTNAALVSLGAEALPEDQVASFVGEGARVLVSRALEAAEMDLSILDRALAAFLDIYDARLLDCTRPYDGVMDVIANAAAAGVLMGVITNKPQAPSERLLQAFDMTPHFRWIVGGDTPFRRKPDPASLAWMMNEAGTAAEATLFVGDTSIDAQTARRGGVNFCLAEYGFGQANAPTPLLQDEFRAVTARDITTAIDLVRAR